MHNQFTSMIIIMIASNFISLNNTSLFGKDNSNEISKKVNELVSFIKLDDTMNFCGEKIPFTNKNSETFEREMAIAVSKEIQVILWLKRANRYFPIIEKELKKNNLPDDLKYIPVIESDLKTMAGSPKGALGYWQFMKSTAINYDLIVNKEIDERLNITKSTKAAIKYLTYLHEKFKSWSLAAAAYNMGEDGLMSQMIIQNTSNYHDLYLSLETMQYVYRIIAAKQILSQPQKYGYKIPKKDLYDEIKGIKYSFKTKQDTPLQIIAKSAGITFKRLKELNPEIRGYFLKKGKHQILLPNKEAVKSITKNYQNTLQKWLSDTAKNTYTVAKGDNLTLIAEKFKIPINSLLLLNRLNPQKYLKPGQKLIIPQNNNY